MSHDLHREIEGFLYREARLLDEGRYDEWFELLTDDVRYWIPIRETTATLDEAISGDEDTPLIDDDKAFLKARIQRIHSGLAHAETPPSRTRRFLSNMEIEARTDGECEAACNMLVYQTRLERTQALYVGRREDRLRKANGSWRIARRKIILDQTLLPRTISVLL